MSHSKQDDGVHRDGYVGAFFDRGAAEVGEEALEDGDMAHHKDGGDLRRERAAGVRKYDSIYTPRRTIRLIRGALAGLSPAAPCR